MTKEKLPQNKGLLEYFEKQEKIYPKRVHGRYRNLKWAAMIITLGIYYLVPFIRWDRGPNAPDQAVLIDLNGPRAYWFWIGIAWCTAGSFVLYFNDAPTLVWSFFEFDVSPTVLYFIIGLTLSTYIMAGFAREQVCTYVCPYSRFQSAMFDRDTLIIGYDEKRGEERGKHKKGESWDNRGHCIDCSLCVQVCPMGIDIRNGLQMECIACGLCVDACNGVMEKLDLPKGLIRYDTTNHMAAEVKGGEESFKFLRPRTLYYTTIMAIVGGIMLYALIFRSPLELHVLHDRNPVYTQLSSGEIRNGYTIKILNKTHTFQSYTLTVDGLPDARIEVKAAGDIDAEHLNMPADSVGSYKVYVSALVQPDEPRDVTFTLRSHDGEKEDSYESNFVSRR